MSNKFSGIAIVAAISIIGFECDEAIGADNSDGAIIATVNEPTAADSAAFNAKVDPQNGVVVDVGNAHLKTLPSVKILSADEIDRGYSPPAGVEFDYYQYSLSADVDNGEGTLSLGVLDAENMALAHSWQLRSVIAGRDAARGQKYGAIGGLLPSFGYTANYGLKQSGADNLPYTPAERSTFSQTPGFTQPLFHGGQLISALREANLNVDKVENDIRAQRLTVRSQIRQLYYLCLYNKKAADVARKQTDISYEYWQKTQKRYEAEDVPEIEVLRYRVQHQLDKSAYITARNGYNNSITQLLRYLGQPLKSNIFLNDAFDFTEFDPGSEEELTQYALRNRPDLKSSNLNEQMLHQRVKQAKAQLLPTVDGMVNFTQGTDWSTQSERYVGNWGWAAGVQLNWNALAGMGQVLRGRIMQANAALTQAEFNTADISDQIKQGVRSAVINIFSAIDAVKAQQENVEQANRLLTQENIRWDEGASDYLKILDAQKSVSNSELAYWRGIYDFKIAVVDLEASLGKFYQSTNDEVRAARATKKDSALKKTNSEAAASPLDALATPNTLKIAKTENAANSPKSEKAFVNNNGANGSNSADTASVRIAKINSAAETKTKAPLADARRDFSALGGSPIPAENPTIEKAVEKAKTEKNISPIDSESYTPPQFLTPLTGMTDEYPKNESTSSVDTAVLTSISPIEVTTEAPILKSTPKVYQDLPRKSGANRAVNATKIRSQSSATSDRIVGDTQSTKSFSARDNVPVAAAIDLDVMANPQTSSSGQAIFLAEPELE